MKCRPSREHKRGLGEKYCGYERKLTFSHDKRLRVSSGLDDRVPLRGEGLEVREVGDVPVAPVLGEDVEHHLLTQRAAKVKRVGVFIGYTSHLVAS